MDFQEWWAQHGHGMWRDDKALASQVAGAAWDAATNAERERCAALCDSLPESDPKGAWFNDDMSLGARECAEAIRAS